MDGLLVVDKPVGPTSHDVVARARRVLAEPRVGHTGTLDPAASGVLPLLLGRTTRLARFLTSADKTYQATIRLGITTDTYDGRGRPIGLEHEGPLPSYPAVDRALDGFRGTFLQRPPAYSAKKIRGTRSYKTARDAARTGTALAEEALPAAVHVTAHEIALIEVDGARVELRIHCSGGFYIRSLAHDLGERLGTGAHLAALRRTRSGDRTLDDAVSLEMMEGDRRAALERLVKPAAILPSLAAVVLTGEGVRRAVHGMNVGAGDLVPEMLEGGSLKLAGTAFRLLDERGDLVAVAEPAPAGGDGLLHPCVVLM